jgi:hypothetical protein
LIRRKPRTSVDLDLTAEIVPRVCGLLLAQAGERNGGPGPGWLGPELRAHAEPCAGARGPGFSRPRAHAREPGFKLGLAEGVGRLGRLPQKESCIVFSISISIFP